MPNRFGLTIFEFVDSGKVVRYINGNPVVIRAVFDQIVLPYPVPVSTALPG